MAIIATVMASNGVTVRIHDDRIAPRGSEEERRAIEAQRRAAYEIMEGRVENGDDRKNA